MEPTAQRRKLRPAWGPHSGAQGSRNYPVTAQIPATALYCPLVSGQHKGSDPNEDTREQSPGLGAPPSIQPGALWTPPSCHQPPSQREAALFCSPGCPVPIRM